MTDDKNANPPIIERIGQCWGQYRIISSVEQGRFSQAYLGEHRQDHTKQCVIEILPITLTNAIIPIFQQQVQPLTRLVHPHILRIIDAGVEQATPFIVMEYVSHIPLRQLYRKGEGQSLEKLLPYVKQVAEALHYAHEHEILHKNLRPENVLLGQNDAVFLYDFAIDVIHQDEHYQKLLRRKAICDPMTYVAPEQLKHQDCKASDQYALGVMVYEWLCGAPPFQGARIEIANQHVYTLPLGLRQKVPTLAPAVEAAVLTALAKDPHKRFGSVVAFISALEQAYVATASSSPNAYATAPELVAHIPSTPAPVAYVPATPPPVVQPIRPQAVQPSVGGFQAAQTFSAPTVADQPAPPVRSQQKAGNATRRAFLVSVAGLALVGGGGSWLLWRKLHPAGAVSSVVNTNGDTTGTTTTSSGEPVLVYRAHHARVNSVVWSPDSQSVASASDDNLVLICNRAGKTLLTYSGHSDHVNAVAWSPNGQYIASASADQTVQVWNATTGKRVYTYQGHTAAVNSVDWSADSRMIASGSDDHTVHAWFAATGSVFLYYLEHTNAVVSVAWSPDTQKIASGSWDNTLQVCSTISNAAFAVGDKIFSYAGHTAEVYSVSWSPDGSRIASGGGDNVVQVCSGVDGSSLHYPPRPHDKPVRSVIWSPNGNYIVSASDDETVRIWSARTGEDAFTFRGHTDAVLSVAWSHDSKLIASAGADKTLQVWQPQL